MTKQEEFLLLVQTSVLANSINIGTIPDAAQKYRHVISCSGVFITMDEAIRVSYIIPKDMSALDAANQFITFFLENQRHTEEEAKGAEMECPYWCARS